MADERRSKRRKKGERRRKLLLGEKVEVFYFEDGLLGSWHSGVVVGCGEDSRAVEYTNLLSDDQDSKLVESIAVSDAIEGTSKAIPKYHRGKIRPLQHQYSIQRSDIRYGLCVDALVDDAWWEGVVFDHEEDSEERRVFFPDLGDQHMITVGRLRLTQEWNEVSGQWKPRGKWLLLQVLQKYEEEDGLPVSVREIWYDLRANPVFLDKVKAWTFGTQALWHSLVSELIQELQNVVNGTSVSEVALFDEVINVSMACSDMDVLMEDISVLQGTDSHMGCTGMNAGLADSVYSDCSPADDHSLLICAGTRPWERDADRNCSQVATEGEVVGASGAVICVDEPQSLCGFDKLNTERRVCSNALSDFIFAYQNNTCSPDFRKRLNAMGEFAKSYLRSLGWKFIEEFHSCKYFVSPEGTRFYSLVKACEAQKAKEEENLDLQKTICFSGTDTRICDYQATKALCNTICEANQANHCSVSKVSSAWQPVNLEAEYCPQVLSLYTPSLKDGKNWLKQLRSTDLNQRDVKLKLKKHLLALGWKIEAKSDKTMMRLRYHSPDGKCYYSLPQACCQLMKGYQKVNQRCKGDDSSEGDYLGCSRNEIYPAQVHPDPLSLTGDVQVPSWPMKSSKHEKEHYGHALQLFSAEEGSAVSNALTERCISSSEFVYSYGLTESGDKEAFPLGTYEKNSEVVANCPTSVKTNIGLRGDSMNEDLEPEYLPEAINEYCEYIQSQKANDKQEVSSTDVKLLRLNAKKHLLFMGWRFWHRAKGVKQELCYGSPDGKLFHSLSTACKAYLEECFGKTYTKLLDRMDRNKRFKFVSPSLSCENSVKNNSLCRCLGPSTAVTSDESAEAVQALHEGAGKESAFSNNLSEFSELRFGKLQPRGIRNSKKRTESSFSIGALHDRLSYPSARSSDCRQSKKRKTSKGPSRQAHGSEKSSSLRVLRSSKRSRQVVASLPSQHTAKTVLSWLIDNDVLLPRQKVSYIRKKDGPAVKDGRVNRDGIKCSCCKKVYSLIKFEAHAGNNTSLPSANIYLQDGRSILQCQMQMMHTIKPKDFLHVRLKGDYSQHQSDTVCSICQDGGTLMLCDYCPSSFHPGCVGLKDVPEGQWFCPSCRCGICGLGEYNCDTEQFTEQTVLYCDQCEREYHVGCLRERGSQRLSSCPTGNWFCSKGCSKIFLHLRKLLGKRNPTSVDGLSWTILRSSWENGVDRKIFDLATLAEHHSKLCLALDVLHECFVTMIEPRTQSDVVADLLFNNESELNRLNFWGYYTMLLEKGDELISVATFRVYGEKVAEVPLVGTRVHYRRQGMCRLLINELEKLLSSLGVDRLLLPAVPQLLETWTTSFGFTKMTTSERMELVEYTLLNFPETTLCQKHLKTSLAAKEPKRNHDQLGERSRRSEEQIGCDNYSIITPDVLKNVEPIIASRSLGVGLPSLPGEGDAVEVISYQTDAACSLPVSSSADQLVGMMQNETNEQTTLSVASGKCEDSCALVKMSPTVEVKPMHGEHKFSGKCYERIQKTGASRGHSIRSIDVRSACNFKYYQRKTIAAKLPSY